MFMIGIDCGANSARALVERSADGAEVGSSVVGCPSGDDGVLLDESERPLARHAPVGFSGTCDSPSAQAVPYGGMNVHSDGPRRARTSDKEVDNQ